tara:strand:+ start:1212 stop:2270 length:1059 start_codon:yes stop_codon:yes gene_type:complete
MKKRSLLDRLNKEPVICAEGFLFEAERRGYMSSGEFVPEIALENPDALRNIHRDFQHAGSDVVVAFTYNGHREKMKVINKEHLIESLNRSALQIARQVSEEVKFSETNLLAGNISGTHIWDPNNENIQKEIKTIFDEMVKWSKEEKADFVIGETFYYAEEAFAALESIQKYNLPSVITISPMGENIMRDGLSIIDTCKELELRGADVVGMNCFRGPNTMMPYLKKIRDSIKCHMAALPITYRTTEEQPTFFNLDDTNNCTCHSPHGRTFPTALDPLYCNRYEIRKFIEEAHSIGINYLGLCCGASPMLIREIANAIKREVPASKYNEKMTNHFMYGSNERIPVHSKEYGDKA